MAGSFQPEPLPYVHLQEAQPIFIPDAMAARWGVKGVIIGRVAPGSPAEQAGLRGTREAVGGRIEMGDVITKLAGEPVETLDDMLSILDRHKVGDQVQLEFQRDSRPHQVTITLQEIES